MATDPRAIKQIQNALVRSHVVAASQTVTLGKTVVFASATTYTIQDSAGASDIEFGIAYACDPRAGTASGLGADANGVCNAGSTVEVILLGLNIVPMLVGTGGTTAGKKQVVVATGITDVAANGGGTTAVECIGIAYQSGVAGDVVGVITAGPNSRVSA